MHACIYNKINNKNKQFSDYLKNKQTQELLKFYQKDIDPENSLDQYENNEKWNQEFLQPIQKMKILL